MECIRITCHQCRAASGCFLEPRACAGNLGAWSERASHSQLLPFNLSQASVSKLVNDLLQMVMRGEATL